MEIPRLVCVCVCVCVCVRACVCWKGVRETLDFAVYILS